MLCFTIHFSFRCVLAIGQAFRDGPGHVGELVGEPVNVVREVEALVDAEAGHDDQQEGLHIRR